MTRLEKIFLSFLFGVCFFKPIKIAISFFINNICPILGVKTDLPQIPSLAQLSIILNDILINGINQHNIGIILIPIFIITMLIVTSWAIQRVG